MAGDHPLASAAAIRAESAWLRRLSWALLRHGDDAEDAVQETWLTSVAHPPLSPGPMGGWLRVVLRNVARKRARTETRRRAREGRAAGLVADTPSSEELALRVEAQRLVADLVLALDEPYRSTVILSYYEGLSPAAVARRLDVPAGTVRWRLSYALGKLRTDLDGRYASSRHAWRAFLVPFAPSMKAGWLGSLGKVIMAVNGTTKAGLLAAAALLLALGTGGLFLGERFARSGVSADTRPEAPDPNSPSSGRGPGLDPGRGSRKRQRVLVPRFEVDPTTAPAAEPGVDPTTAPAAEPGAAAGGPQDLARDPAALKLAMHDRMREAGDRVKACMRRWATLDPALNDGVRLTLQLDQMGLQQVWLEDRSDVPSGSLGCLSEAVYQTDWSGITTSPVRTAFTIRVQRTDGGP